MKGSPVKSEGRALSAKERAKLGERETQRRPLGRSTVSTRRSKFRMQWGGGLA